MSQAMPCGKNENSQGFSLLETSIALVIMMVVTLATGSLFVYATKYNSGAVDRSAALATAQRTMERLRRTGFSDAELTAGSTSQTVTNNGRLYTVATNICATSDCGGSATLKIITIQVTPQGSSQWVNVPIILVSQRATPVVGSYASY